MRNVLKSVMAATLVVVALSASQSFAFGSVGFSHGNQLTMLNLTGKIKVNSPCRPRSSRGYEIIKCESKDLFKGNEDYFVGPVNPDAVEVVLVSHTSAGEVHSKTAEYNGVRGRSSGTVNLWHSTLFQSPLLDVGNNTVRYSLKDENGQVLQTGSFLVQVNADEEKVCPMATYQSLSNYECNVHRSVCQTYFRKSNFCQK